MALCVDLKSTISVDCCSLTAKWGVLKISNGNFGFTMAQRDYKAFLEKWLPRFLLEEDSIKSMLEWLLTELMKAEAEAKVGAPKGKHSWERKTHLSGYRVRKLHSRVDTVYLAIPKIRKEAMHHFSWRRGNVLGRL